MLIRLTDTPIEQSHAVVFEAHLDEIVDEISYAIELFRRNNRKKLLNI